MANTIDFNVSTNAVTVLNQTTEAAENTAQGFTSAKAELRALQNQMLQMDQTSAEFKKAAERAAELKDNIGDLSAELRANAGNAFEGVSNNISLFGSRLMSLDLKGAGQALTAVGEASKKIGFKEMATELGGLIKGVISLGKALITNPLFLLGTIIATIVTNFDSLSKSGGVLGKILTEIGNLIDWAIQGFTDLTDAIGLTSIAAQKEAEKIKEVAEEIRNELANIDKDISAEKAKAVVKSLIIDNEVFKASTRNCAFAVSAFFNSSSSFAAAIALASFCLSLSSCALSLSSFAFASASSLYFLFIAAICLAKFSAISACAAASSPANL